METAVRYGSKPNIYSCVAAKDLTLNIALKGGEPQIGQDAHLTIILKNSSSEKRSVFLHCQVAVMYYNGVQKGTVMNGDVSVNIKPKDSERLCSSCLVKYIAISDKLKNLKFRHMVLGQPKLPELLYCALAEMKCFLSFLLL